MSENTHRRLKLAYRKLELNLITFLLNAGLAVCYGLIITAYLLMSARILMLIHSIL